jgi:microcystin-dependent protein
MYTTLEEEKSQGAALMAHTTPSPTHKGRRNFKKTLFFLPTRQTKEKKKKKKKTQLTQAGATGGRTTYRLSQKHDPMHTHTLTRHRALKSHTGTSKVLPHSSTTMQRRSFRQSTSVPGEEQTNSWV